jgi:hypothetical protein
VRNTKILVVLCRHLLTHNYQLIFDYYLSSNNIDKLKKKVTISLIANIIIVDLKKIVMSHIITKTLAVVVVVATVVALIVIIPGYLLQEVKAATKTHNLSTSMSTSCNGDTDEPCQTVVCKNDKPCHTVDSNSDQTDMTTACKDNKPCGTLVDSNSSPQQQQKENATAAEEAQQQPDSSSSNVIPPTPQIPYDSDDVPEIPDYDDEFD